MIIWQERNQNKDYTSRSISLQKTYVFIEKHIKQRYLAVEVMGTQTKYSRYLEILRRLIQQVEG